MSRLIQLMGDGIEELWNFPDDVTDEQIQEAYKQYEEANMLQEYEDFEDYLDNFNPQMQGERIFVDEVYV